MRKRRQLDVSSSLREAQNDTCNRNVKQETAARWGQTGRASVETALLHLAFFAVGNQLVQDQGVNVASARPQHHEDYHLELVGTDDFVG